MQNIPSFKNTSVIAKKSVTVENTVHTGSKTSSPLPRGLGKLSLLTTGEVLTYSLAGF